MRTKIKQWGDSKVIILSKEYMEYMDIKLGDWLDITDAVKVSKNNFIGDEY